MSSLFTHRAFAAGVLAFSVVGCSASSGPSLMPSTVAPPVTGASTGISPTLLAPDATFTKNPHSKYGHVFVVLLENKDESTTYGTGSAAPYLASTVKKAGAFAANYYATGHASLDNYIAIASGQAPNALTSADCPIYLNFTNTTTTTDGQAAGAGCVFPNNIPNIADQLRMANIPWRSYDEDMGNDPSREASTCGHPSLNSQDMTQDAEAPSAANGKLGDQYATRHNPFMYFHSVIDDESYCQTHVVNSTHLATDLKSISTTPNFAFYTPNLCNDGHDSGCVTGEPGGYSGINTEMQTLVPLITGSPAFKQDGLLIIIFDEADTSDTSSCCGEMPGPTDPDPGEEGGTGGGKVGAILLSPFIKPNTVTMSDYNHYALLASIEDIFGLTHIGYAAQSGFNSIGTDPTINTVKSGATKTDVYSLVSKR